MRFFPIILFFLLSVTLYSEDLNELMKYDYSADIHVGGSFHVINDLIVDMDGTNYRYEFDVEENLPFFYFGKGFDGKRDNKRLILFSKDFLLIYGDDDRRLFFGTTLTARRTEAYGFFEIAKASSSLTEGSTTYSTENLSSFDQRRPWVEGVEGPGIGEFLEVEKEHGITNIIISIGYVDSLKPWLYKENSRPQRIKIVAADYELIYYLKDTPNPQRINFPKRTDKFKIEIVDVFEGTKYADTCINFILTDFLYGEGPL